MAVRGPDSADPHGRDQSVACGEVGGRADGVTDVHLARTAVHDGTQSRPRRAFTWNELSTTTPERKARTRGGPAACGTSQVRGQGDQVEAVDDYTSLHHTEKGRDPGPAVGGCAYSQEEVRPAGRETADSARDQRRRQAVGLVVPRLDAQGVRARPVGRVKSKPTTGRRTPRATLPYLTRAFDCQRLNTATELQQKQSELFVLITENRRGGRPKQQEDITLYRSAPT